MQISEMTSKQLHEFIRNIEIEIPRKDRIFPWVFDVEREILKDIKNSFSHPEKVIVSDRKFVEEIKSKRCENESH